MRKEETQKPRLLTDVLTKLILQGMELLYISYLSDGTDDLKKAIFESENSNKICIFQFSKYYITVKINTIDIRLSLKEVVHPH